MNKIIFILLLLATVNTGARAQFSDGPADSARTEILQLTSEWNKAILNRDSLTLDKLLASDYSLNGSVPRNSWMNNTLHHIATDKLETVSALTITFYGQAARSEGTFFWKASFDGTPRINAEYSICDIWIKRNDRWQILLRMSQQSKKR